MYSLMKQRYVNLPHSFITKYRRIFILGKLNHEQYRRSISKPWLRGFQRERNVAINIEVYGMLNRMSGM